MSIGRATQAGTITGDLFFSQYGRIEVGVNGSLWLEGASTDEGDLVSSGDMDLVNYGTITRFNNTATPGEMEIDFATVNCGTIRLLNGDLNFSRTALFGFAVYQYDSDARIQIGIANVLKAEDSLGIYVGAGAVDLLGNAANPTSDRASIYGDLYVSSTYGPAWIDLTGVNNNSQSTGLLVYGEVELEDAGLYSLLTNGQEGHGNVLVADYFTVLGNSWLTYYTLDVPDLSLVINVIQADYNWFGDFASYHLEWTIGEVGGSYTVDLVYDDVSERWFLQLDPFYTY